MHTRTHAHTHTNTYTHTHKKKKMLIPSRSWPAVWQVAEAALTLGLFTREVLPLCPDGHRGEGPGRKKLDPRSNSSRMLWTGEAGPAEGINTQTEEAGWSDLSITRCLHSACERVVYIYYLFVCVCVCVCALGEGERRGERGEGNEKEEETEKEE